MKEYKFKINGKDYEVSVESVKDGQAEVSVNGTSYFIEVDRFAGGRGVDSVDPTASLRLRSPHSRAVGGTSPATGNRIDKNSNGVDSPEGKQALGSSNNGKVIESPLPGVILNLYIIPGQNVKRGDRLAVLEAMKMENDILATVDGTVKEVFVQRGDSVLEGAKIAIIG